jgi:hypothetical protein
VSLSAGTVVGGTPRQFVELTGHALGSVSSRGQRELVATMLAPSRVVERGIGRAEADGLALFVALHAGRRRIHCAQTPRFGVGVFSPADASVACIMRAVGRRPTLEAWGGIEAERALVALREEWRSIGAPRLGDYTFTAAEQRAALGNPRRVLACGDFVLGIGFGRSGQGGRGR